MAPQRLPKVSGSKPASRSVVDVIDRGAQKGARITTNIRTIVQDIVWVVSLMSAPFLAPAYFRGLVISTVKEIMHQDASSKNLNAELRSDTWYGHDQPLPAIESSLNLFVSNGNAENRVLAQEKTFRIIENS